MAYYSYKRVRDLLMEKGWLDKYGNPVNTEKYGEGLDNSYRGNLWEMAADYIQQLKAEVEDLESDLYEANNE